MSPIVGISCCTKPIGPGGSSYHAASDLCVLAVDSVVKAIPVLIPANGLRAEAEKLLMHLHGVVLTGSASNIQPSLYSSLPHVGEILEDGMRDAVTMPLIRAAARFGVPVLAICRGLQELNVSLGGTLHQAVHTKAGYIDHSSPGSSNLRIRIAKAHIVKTRQGGWLRKLAALTEFPVNSLHDQGIDKLASPLIAEGFAVDGLIEAVRLNHDSFFMVGVQWHPEYDFETDPISRKIFESFGDAVRTRMKNAAR